MLKLINTTGKKIGIEVNEAAKKTVIKNGVEYHKRIEEVPKNSVDIVVSHMALEHVECPAYYIKEMMRVVRPGGKIAVVVPHEILKKTGSGKTDKHIYTWSPQHMENLFEFCGIDVVLSDRKAYLWPPKYTSVQRIVGWKLFRKLSTMYGFIRRIYFTRTIGIVNK